MKKLISLIKIHWQKLLIITLVIYLLVLNNRISSVEKELDSKNAGFFVDQRSSIDRIELDINNLKSEIEDIKNKQSFSVKPIIENTPSNLGEEDLRYKLKNLGEKVCELDGEIGDIYREIGQSAKAVRFMCRF